MAECLTVSIGQVGGQRGRVHTVFRGRDRARVPGARLSKYRSVALAKKGQRTTHRSVSGTKLYAGRDPKGRLKDIQTYRRAHGQDIKRNSKRKGSRPVQRPER